MLRLTVLAAALLMFAGFAPVPDTAALASEDALKKAILSGIETRYNHHGFSAAFVQTSTLTALDVTETATGKAWFSHPGKMKWQYLSPERHDIITNGRELWIFRPDDNQVMVGKADRFFQSGAGGAFLSDITLLREQFTISVTETSDQLVTLHLAAKNPSDNPDTQSIEMTVNRNTFDIVDIVTENAQGDTTRFQFSDIRFQAVPDDWFDFIPPPGVDRMEM